MHAWPKYLLLFAVLCTACNRETQTQSPEAKTEKVTFVEHLPEQRIDVLINDKLFTAYRWPDKVFKPVLYPIISSGGSTITRGFPLEARENERNDHRHQVGSWLNYGNVNGYDFWGNGHTGGRIPNGGEIKHVSIEKATDGNGVGTLITRASWVSPSGEELLAEKTAFYFSARDSIRIIDRVTTLRATGAEAVRFEDTKEGMFGLRVASALELPSEDKIILTDATGNAKPEKQKNESATGNYRSSEGIAGAAVWSTRARWMDLSGTIGDEKVSVVICDHPKNISYPTWWHARGYGLFSANPLGAKDFTKGQQELNHSVSPGDSLTFRYRIIVSSGEQLSNEAINRLADEFATAY